VALTFRKPRSRRAEVLALGLTDFSVLFVLLPSDHGVRFSYGPSLIAGPI